MAKKATATKNSEESVTLNVLDTTNTTGTTNTTDTTENVNSDEIIDVPWESIQDVFEFKQKLENMETYFADMCLNFEKNKTNLMAQIMYGQSDLYNMAQTLQKSFNVNTNITYELKLPAKSGEKGYFVRKDQT